MVFTKELHQTSRSLWLKAFSSLLPLWLFSITIMAEGFPSPPVPLFLAITLLLGAISTSILLLFMHWIRIELGLFSMYPLILIIKFDEIATGYKTPFIILCAFLLSIAALMHWQSRSDYLGIVILFSAALITWAVATNATNGYWRMVDLGGFANCYPNCLPTPDQGHPWWRVFLTR